VRELSVFTSSTFFGHFGVEFGSTNSKNLQMDQYTASIGLGKDMVMVLLLNE
jgi:hypothetical protein